MSALEEICSRYTSAPEQDKKPLLNAIVAGYTDAKSTRFLAAKGVKNIETKEPATVDDLLCLFSCTKSMTAMAVLILWERGLLELDVPAKNYLPILGEFGIIEEEDLVDPDTGDLLKPPTKPKNSVTIRHLLLHTSGFCYVFTDNNYLNIMSKKGVHAGKPLADLFKPEIMPLVFEPGTQWSYGHGYDWLGEIIRAVSGQTLSDFLEENVFSKAGMESCTFQVTDTSKLIRLHDRNSGELSLFKSALPVPHTAKVDMGGQGCYGSVGDYLKFMRIWLNYGTSPDTGVQILKTETVKYALQNHLPEEFLMNFPLPLGELTDGYTLAGCAITKNVGKNGRAAGSIYWTGFANLYFWVDFENGCAGFWGCQVLPYYDGKCVRGFFEFEKAVYHDLKLTSKF